MRTALKKLPLILFAMAAAAVWADGPAWADGPVISGNINGSLNTLRGTGSSPDYLYGFEQYANLRLQGKVGDFGRVYSAVNLIAASGINAAAASSPLALSGYTVGQNYAAALELERLYVRLSSEYSDTDFGLMRIAFGYGQAFRPTDFLNPPNPLLPDARPRGVLGLSFAAYPSFDVKLQGFAVSPEDPLEQDGLRYGAVMDAHFSRGSIQTLYSYQAPDDETELGLHRVGLSVKLEAELGIVLDALYTLDPEDTPGWEGLETSIGTDYSFLDGKLYILAQYLYNGPGYLDPDDDLDDLSLAMESGVKLGLYNRKNYLFSQAIYSYSDITRWGLSCLAGLDDVSLSPVLSVEHEPFQGMVVGMRCTVPYGDDGELGPDFTGTQAALTVTAKLRF